MTDIPVGNLAGYLAQYWQHALAARSANLISGQFNSKKVQELVAFANWHNSSWDINFKANHSLAMHQIITRNADEIRMLTAKAKESKSDEDISYILDMVNQLDREMSAAMELQELISGW